jgi:hypothetical protein
VIFIKHRVNKISELETVSSQWGVEIDLRSNVVSPNSFHLSHDPWRLGDDFELWLQEFKRRGIDGPLILNTKEDGLEFQILEILGKFDIGNFFFLDTAPPTLVKWTKIYRESRFAVRASIYEPPSTSAAFQGDAQWVWVDCFDKLPMPQECFEELKQSFKICLVSPELQGGALDDCFQFRKAVRYADAICTKNPAAWRKIISGLN